MDSLHIFRLPIGFIIPDEGCLIDPVIESGDRDVIGLPIGLDLDGPILSVLLFQPVHIIAAILPQHDFQGNPMVQDRAVADRFGRAALQGSATEIPDYMPYWNTFFLDPVGRLWVERYRPPGTPAHTLHTWEIYGSDGTLLGVLTLPLSGRVTPSVRNNRIAGIVEDDLGVQYVVVFELRTSEP